MIRSVSILLLLLFSFPGHAGEMIAGPVFAELVKVRDGDSLDVLAHIWPGQQVKVSVRIRGIDAPELRARCVEEKQLAIAARGQLARLVSNSRIRLNRISGGKYFGRVLADVVVDSDKDVASMMLDMGIVRPYRGRKRKPWCSVAALLKN